MEKGEAQTMREQRQRQQQQQLQEELVKHKASIVELRLQLQAAKLKNNKLQEELRRLMLEEEFDASFRRYEQQYGNLAPTREQLEQQPRNSYWIPGCGWNVGE